ncbi:MAG: hypothetical protein JXB15_12720 [Anaerolineales bacterium]|nr:hypothetical protein [Anaerolineales bacterium]
MSQRKPKFFAFLAVLLILTCSWQIATAAPDQPLGVPLQKGQHKIVGSDAPEDNQGFAVSVNQDGTYAIVGAFGREIDSYADAGTAFIYYYDGIKWTQQARLYANDRADGDRFGISVSISDDGLTALVGADRADANGHTDQGAAYVFTRSGTTWSQQAKITIAAGVDNARLGWSVALSGDGTTALLGAYKANVNGFVDQGAGYVYIRSGSNWIFDYTLTQNVASNWLGYSVALSDAGTTALLGAPGHDGAGGSEQGKAVIFKLTGGIWVASPDLTASDGAAGDWLGRSVALDADGNTALAGASKATVSGHSEQGAGYLFTESGGVWSQAQKFTAAAGQANDLFGVSSALDDSGNIVMIGAYQANLDSLTDNGAIFIQRKVGGVWQSAYWQNPGLESYAQYGVSVSISGDGGTLLAGANLADVYGNLNQGLAYVTLLYESNTWDVGPLISSNDWYTDFGEAVAMDDSGNLLVVGARDTVVNENNLQGAAYVFVPSGAGGWVQVARLESDDGIPGDGFGASVAISGDGNTILVGAPDANVGGFDDQGAAYVFVKSGGTWADWSQQRKLTISVHEGDQMGSAVALSDDGNVALIGAPMATVGGQSAQGMALIFTRSGINWTQTGIYVSPTGTAGDNFGTAVAMNGGGFTALVSSTETVSGHANQGAVYLLVYSGGAWTVGSPIVASDGQAEDYFGISVAINDGGNLALIGAFLKDINGKVDQGAAYIFQYNLGSWTGRMFTEGDAGDNFGKSVAISDLGTIYLVGAMRADIQGRADQGKAYLFSNQNNDWTALRAIFTAQDGKSSDYLGHSVSINGGGNMALLGAPGHNWGGASDDGAAYAIYGDFINGRLFLPLVKR